MSEFQRYAVYYLPDDPALAAFGATWLGWDVATGKAVAQPDLPGIATWTDTPRKYGFHGTLKPPFRLADGTSFAGLQADVADIAGEIAPLRLDGLQVSRLGHFLALTPMGDVAALGAMAFRLVSELDIYRRAPTNAELERRRAAGLNAAQDALLLRWGYPYVAEEFRFHLTLTGRLTPGDMVAVEAALDAHLPAMPSPFEINSIALAGEAADGKFRLIQRYALTG